MKIRRRSWVEAATGVGRSVLYVRISQGLFTKPLSIGGRAVGWAEHEVVAINAARVAGASDDEIRALVRQLHAARASALKAIVAANPLLKGAAIATR